MDPRLSRRIIDDKGNINKSSSSGGGSSSVAKTEDTIATATPVGIIRSSITLVTMMMRMVKRMNDKRIMQLLMLMLILVV